MPILIQVLAHQQIQDLCLIEQKVVGSVAVAIAFDVVAINFAGQGELLPAFVAERQQAVALIELALDHFQELPDVMLYRGMIRPGDKS